MAMNFYLLPNSGRYSCHFCWLQQCNNSGGQVTWDWVGMMFRVVALTGAAAMRQVALAVMKQHAPSLWVTCQVGDWGRQVR